MAGTCYEGAVLEVRALGRSYGSLKAVSGVDLSLHRGERRVVFGANGAGKSTLLNMLAGDISPSSGEIIYQHNCITHLRPALRARLGIRRTYQRSSIFANLTVGENLQVAVSGALPGRFALTRPSARVRERAEELALMVRMADIAARPASELSHGQQRQLELGMALAGDAQLLLLDEPAAGLSHSERQLLASLIQALPHDLTLLFIEHDIDLALSLAETATVMHNGVVIATGPAATVGSSEEVRQIYLGSAK